MGCVHVWHAASVVSSPASPECVDVQVRGAGQQQVGVRAARQGQVREEGGGAVRHARGGHELRMSGDDHHAKWRGCARQIERKVELTSL